MNSELIRLKLSLRRRSASSFNRTAFTLWLSEEYVTPKRGPNFLIGHHTDFLQNVDSHIDIKSFGDLLHDI